MTERPHLLHIKSNEIIEGKPKLPSVQKGFVEINIVSELINLCDNNHDYPINPHYRIYYMIDGTVKQLYVPINFDFNRKHIPYKLIILFSNDKIISKVYKDGCYNSEVSENIQGDITRLYILLRQNDDSYAYYGTNSIDYEVRYYHTPIEEYKYNEEYIDNIPKKYGRYSEKPNKIDIGFAYFCTDRQTSEGATDGIMIYHKGNDVWVDSLGRIIE